MNPYFFDTAGNYWMITEILSYENGEAQVVCTLGTGYTCKYWVRVAEIVVA